MRRYVLFISVFQMAHIAFSQKVVVGLHKMNTVFIGINNPIDIAVEGYTKAQLTISAKGCEVLKDSDQYFLRTFNFKNDTCQVFVSYRNHKKVKTDTLNFKIGQIPKPESYFGSLESGSAYFHDLMNQNEIKAVIPQFYLDDVYYKVTKFDALYVPKRGDAIPFSGKGDQIPLDMKYRIMALKSGDKVLVDGIQAVNQEGITRKLGPIAITIHSSNFKEREDAPNFYKNTQTRDDSLARNNKNSFNNDPWGVYEKGITKGYTTNCRDTQLVFEVKKLDNKILWEKQYYPSGKLKAHYSFDKNDTLGDAISYYENGKLKFKGKVLPKIKTVFAYYRNEVCFGCCFNTDPVLFKDSFFLSNYVPYGHWLCYGEDGKILMDCNFGLINYGKIPVNENDPEFDFSNGNDKRKIATIKEALTSADSYFKVDFVGLFKTYDRKGQLVSEHYHYHQPKAVKPFRKKVPHTYDKILSGYEYYENGKLKEEYDFNENDNIGNAKSYYENGEIKAEGQVLMGIYLGETNFKKEKISFLDTINLMGFYKIGNWKAYHSNGKLALECNFGLFGWLDLQKQLDYFEALKNDQNHERVDEDTIKMKEYSISEVLNNPDNKFYSRLSGSCKIYNEQGDLIKLINFKP